MNTKQKHIDFIKRKGKFTIDCRHDIFTPEEYEVLEKYGHWFMALTTGELEPITELQEEFVLVARQQKEPFFIEQKAWFKYLGRKSVEAKYGDKLKVQYQPESDTFYNRDMEKKLKGMMYGEMKKNHLK